MGGLLKGLDPHECGSSLRRKRWSRCYLYFSFHVEICFEGSVSDLNLAMMNPPTPQQVASNDSDGAVGLYTVGHVRDNVGLRNYPNKKEYRDWLLRYLSQ